MGDATGMLELHKPYESSLSRRRRCEDKFQLARRHSEMVFRLGQEPTTILSWCERDVKVEDQLRRQCPQLDVGHYGYN